MGKGHIKVHEDVPIGFTRREGDWHQEGGNNTLICLGTDRLDPEKPATIDDGLGTIEAEGKGIGTGAILLVAGRKDKKGNPDISNDDSTFYLARKTDVDQNLRLEEIPVDVDPIDDTGPAAILKSDAVRIVFRNNIKIANENVTNYAVIDDTMANIVVSDKVHVLLDSTGPGYARVWVGRNVVDINGGGTITITADDTTTRIKKGGEIKVGHLANALEKLVGIISSCAQTGNIGNLGNLGAPVPINPALVTALNAWVKEWISGDKFIKMQD